MKKNRTQIFNELKVKPTNIQWSWCATNDFLKLSIFTIWEDKEEDDDIWVLHDDNTENKRNGYIDQKRVLDKSISKDYSVFGLVAKAVDPNASPRRIKSINEDFLVKLKLIKKGSKIYARKIRLVSFLEMLSENKSSLKNHGLEDLETLPLGKDVVDRAILKGYVFKRDQKVRSYVLQRAKGRCEYCGEDGFELKNGERYLETHHIIALASQGSDKLENVIALCPNHHRQAHFGLNAEALEKEFITILRGQEG